MPVYRFGPFVLEPARRVLAREGVACELPPKAFDVIVYLVEHRARAVGRDELIAGVWGRVDVSDNVLDQIILRARRTLGDQGEPRRYIATRPRFGFAWMAEVEIVDEAGEPAVAASTSALLTPHGETALAADAASARADAPAAQSRWRTSMRTALSASPASRPRWFAAALALALLSVATLAWMRASDVPVGADGPHRGGGATLVLPLVVAPEAEAGWARLGLMDLVAQRLRDAGIDTSPSDNAVALTRGADATDDDAALREAGARADAARVVGGRVSFEAGRWRVVLRMLERDGYPVTAEADATEPLDAARRAADQLATALGRVPAGVALPQDAALALRLQQIDAAVLGDALDEAHRLLDALSPAQRDEPAVRLRAATLRFRRGELDAADAAFTALLADVSPSDDPHLRGTLLSALGNLALRRGDAAAAERRGDEAVTLLAALPASPELGRAYTGRAIARSTQDRFEPALQDFAQARGVLDAVGDRLGIARVDINAGILDARRDRYAEAEPMLAAAADRLAAFNDLTNELFARVTLAQVRLGLLQPAQALDGDARLAELIAREPNPERQRYAELTRAEVLAANGRIREASARLAWVRESAGTDGDVVLLGVAQAIAAQWALSSDPASAAREAQVALNGRWEDESPRKFATTWRVLVRARLALDDAVAARAALAGFEAWAARRDDRRLDATLWLARAEVAATSGDATLAAEAYANAAAAADASRMPADVVQVAASHAPWLLAQGDATQARGVAGRASAWAEREFEAALVSARLHHALGNEAAWQAALAQARQLGGERALPDAIAQAPGN